MRRRRKEYIGLLLSAAVVAALVVGCGGGSSGGHAGASTRASTATIPAASATTAATGGSARAAKSRTKPSMLAFAECMRAHGVPDYPDPRPPGPPPVSQSPQLVAAPSGGFTANPSSPAYQAATDNCKSLADGTPVSQTQQDQGTAPELRYAGCMRANGVPNFPDPNSDGEIGNDGAITGVDQSSPAYLHAQQDCGKLLARSTGPPGGGPPAP
jgi:hypothetical protein